MDGLDEAQMEQFLDLWAPWIRQGGRTILSTSALVFVYRRLKTAVVGQDPLKYAKEIQLPTALSRAEAVSSQLRASLADMIEDRFPTQAPRAKLHTTGLLQKDKLVLWDTLKANSLVQLTVMPLLWSLVVNVVCLRTTLGVLRAAMAPAVGGEGLNAVIMSRMMRELGGGMPLAVAEDEMVGPLSAFTDGHIDDLLGPAAQAVAEVFTEAFSIRSKTTPEDLRALLAAARGKFEAAVNIPELLARHSIAVMSGDEFHEKADPAGNDDEALLANYFCDLLDHPSFGALVSDLADTVFDQELDEIVRTVDTSPKKAADGSIIVLHAVINLAIEAQRTAGRNVTQPQLLKDFCEQLLEQG